MGGYCLYNFASSFLFFLHCCCMHAGLSHQRSYCNIFAVGGVPWSRLLDWFEKNYFRLAKWTYCLSCSSCALTLDTRYIQRVQELLDQCNTSGQKIQATEGWKAGHVITGCRSGAGPQGMWTVKSSCYTNWRVSMERLIPVWNWILYSFMSFQ